MLKGFILGVTLVISLAFAVGLFIKERRPKWEEVSVKDIVGSRTKGDPRMPKSSWWNVGILNHFFWETIVVFEVPEGTKEYRIGFLIGPNKGRVLTEKVTTRTFSVMIGREPCTFFAIDESGKEIPIKTMVKETPLF